MASFESKFIYPYMKKNVITVLWFIDDLFMIWTDAGEERLKFINQLNQKHKSIKFDFKPSKTKTEFLDVLVCKDVSNKLQATLYKKTNLSPKLFIRKFGTPKIIKRNQTLNPSFTSQAILLHKFRICSPY